MGHEQGKILYRRGYWKDVEISKIISIDIAPCDLYGWGIFIECENNAGEPLKLQVPAIDINNGTIVLHEPENY